MGDLVQSLPLIANRCQAGSVTLVCDQDVRDWAALLPGVDEVLTLDTRRWRQSGVSDRLDLKATLTDLQLELNGLLSIDAECCIPMNDHPMCDRLADSIVARNPHDWLDHPLMMVRSYLRSIVRRRSWNRIHLSDLWSALAPPGENRLDWPPLQVSEAGRRFAKTALTGFRERDGQPLVAFIVGSGGRYRRLDPEDMAAWWKAIPAEVRPGCVLVGGGGEENLADRFLQAAGSNARKVLNLVGRCSPEALLGVFSDVDLVIGVDTGPLHWAAAVGTRVLGIYFGEAGLFETGPPGDGHLVLAPVCDRYPCDHPTALECGYRCLQDLKTSHRMSDLIGWGIQESSQSNVTAPGEFRLFRSCRTDAGQQYESLTGAADSEDVTLFSFFARGVFEAVRTQHENDDNSGLASAVTSRAGASIDTPIKSWLHALGNLPVIGTVPNAYIEETKLASIDFLNRRRELLRASLDDQVFV
jgi:ADP-heptose:LPS heptosyltransferase